MACIKLKGLSRSKVAPETLFVKPLYVKSRHFGPNRYFIFSSIAHQVTKKHLL